MTAERFDVYKCDHCGIIIEVLGGGAGTLVCCNTPMRLLKENATDAAIEKHVPIIEVIPNGVKVSVGNVAHPMLEEHYVEWIEIIADGKIYRQYLKPHEKPEAVFNIQAENIVIREYCNLHGLWKLEK
ncbi:MAG: desulfoferrodoxin [bacterium]